MTFGVLLLCAAATVATTDGAVWNAGVDAYRAGDVTNALAILKPLLLSKTHGARAAEVVAALAYERGDLETAASAAQIALRAAPDDPKANRNFTRATDALPRLRDERRVREILQRAQGQDPGALMREATRSVRRLLEASAAQGTNRAARAVAEADRLGAEASRLADQWLPVRETIVQSVTNEEQAATILQQLDAAQAKTRQAARELADLSEGAYTTLADVEHDFTRFLKLTILPPAAVDEGLLAQSNAWLDVAAPNGRNAQREALDYTQAFRAKFPAWARAYEQEAQADTNRAPFTAETQAKVSALATRLEKLQLECCESVVPAVQEEAIGLLNEIRALLPKDRNGGSGGGSSQPQAGDSGESASSGENEPQDGNHPPPGENGEMPESGDREEEPPPSAEAGEESDAEEDPELEALLKKAQERNDEHEEEKRARARKAKLPPNERDW